MKLTLNKNEAVALKELLTRILTYVNYGAGVDAWLGNPEEENLLLDPDDEKNAHLCNILAKLGDPSVIVQQTAGATMRGRFLTDIVPGLLEDNWFKVKK